MDKMLPLIFILNFFKINSIFEIKISINIYFKFLAQYLFTFCSFINTQKNRKPIASRKVSICVF